MTNKAFVHIGFDKTGTSAIQNYCSQHSKGLLKKTGFLYPAIGRLHDAHMPIAQCAGFGFIGNRELARQAHRYDEIERLLQLPDAPNLLISTEHFCYGTDPDRFRNLHRLLKGHDVKIIVYIRSMPAWLRSLYSEGVKWGFQESFTAFLDVVRDRMDYAAFLDLWSAEFGADNLVIRLYDQEKHRLVSSFLALLHPELCSPDADSLVVNPSLTPLDLEIVKTANISMKAESGHDAYDFYRFFCVWKADSEHLFPPPQPRSSAYGFSEAMQRILLDLTQNFADRYLTDDEDRAFFIRRTQMDLEKLDETLVDQDIAATLAGRLADLYGNRTSTRSRRFSLFS